MPDIKATNIDQGSISFDDAEDSAPYVTGQFCIEREKAKEMIATLDSNSSTARAARDPLAREILEAIKESPSNP